MPSTKRSIGIIGVGFGAQVHAPGFRSEGWEVAAICSRNREKVQKAAADAGIAGIHTDPMELINATISTRSQSSRHRAHITRYRSPR
jgi:predicted dehydrogenase